ncbi:MAG: hypothetical protein WAX14_06780 [Rhodococcus sp. (in: high G+C Gram-positive bacteria)]|uniref:hypothetical protein n=1 Tax=Rhodococcus sp. TaxID=1831 RepID=UPI003BB6F300
MAPTVRWFALVVLFGSGALAAFAIRESAAFDFEYATHLGWTGIFVTPQWAGTVAAVTAGGTLAALLHSGNRTAVAMTTLAGAVAIGAPDIASVATAPAGTINAIGAGLLLAAAGYTAAGSRDRLVALSIGVLAATMFFGVTGLWRVPTDRWAVTLPGEPFYVAATVPLPILIAAVVVLGAVIFTTNPPGSAVDRRSVLAGIGLPVIFLMLYIVLGSTESGPISWTLAVVLAVAAVIGAAWWLPTLHGRVLLLGLAFAAVTIGQVSYSTGSERWLLGGVFLLAGAATGRRYPSVALPVGLALLVVVTATGLLPSGGSAGHVMIAAYALVLPGILGLSVASVLSTTTVHPPTVERRDTSARDDVLRGFRSHRAGGVGVVERISPIEPGDRDQRCHTASGCCRRRSGDRRRRGIRHPTAVGTEAPTDERLSTNSFRIRKVRSTRRSDGSGWESAVGRAEHRSCRTERTRGSARSARRRDIRWCGRRRTGSG